MVLAGTAFSAASRPLDAQLHGSSALKGCMRAFKGDETDREKKTETQADPSIKGHCCSDGWVDRRKGHGERGDREREREGQR